jgi:hypothetical protein
MSYPFTRSSIHRTTAPPTAPTTNVRSNMAEKTSHGGSVSSRLCATPSPGGDVGSAAETRSWTSVEST